MTYAKHVAAYVIALSVAAGLGSTSASALTITQTTDGTVLLNALVTDTTGFSGLSATYTTGDNKQVGTYTGFSSAPVTIGDGVVLSTGYAEDTVGPASLMDLPSHNFSGGSTPEIDAYAPGKVTNWSGSYDAAVLQLDFSLDAAGAVAFDFIFGSIEFPVYTDSYTDAVYIFVDGVQISFDSNGDAVQVGTSFAGLLTTADTNSAFADPHGLLALTTTSGTLAAGAHTILFEIADTNDGILDSAIFLNNFRTATNSGGPTTGGTTKVPEPGTLAIFGMGLAGLALLRRRKA